MAHVEGQVVYGPTTSASIPMWYQRSSRRPLIVRIDSNTRIERYLQRNRGDIVAFVFAEQALEYVPRERRPEILIASRSNCRDYGSFYAF